MIQRRASSIVPLGVGLCLASCGYDYGARDTPTELGVRNVKLENGTLSLQGETPHRGVNVFADGCNGQSMQDCPCPLGRECLSVTQANEFEFEFEVANFGSPSCVMTISDGSESQSIRLENCEVLNNTPPPTGPVPPATPNPNVPITPDNPNAPTDLVGIAATVQQLSQEIELLARDIDLMEADVAAIEERLEADIEAAEEDPNLLPRIAEEVSQALRDTTNVINDAHLIDEKLLSIAGFTDRAAGVLTGAGSEFVTAQGVVNTAQAATNAAIRVAGDEAQELEGSLDVAFESLETLIELTEGAAELAEGTPLEAELEGDIAAAETLEERDTQVKEEIQAAILKVQLAASGLSARL